MSKGYLTDADIERIRYGKSVVEEALEEKPLDPNQEEIQGICNNLNEAAKGKAYPYSQILFVPKEFVLKQDALLTQLAGENKRYKILVEAYRNKDLPKVNKMVDTLLVGNSEIVIPGVNGPRLGDEHLSRDTPTEIMNAQIAHKNRRGQGYLKK